jgi:hypothetical protein
MDLRESGCGTQDMNYWQALVGTVMDIKGITE